MAVVEDVEEEQTTSRSSQTVIGDNGSRHRIPSTHPSEVRKTKTTIKPLVDLGLPQQAQDDVMDAINASFASNDPHYRQPRVGDTDEEEEEEEYEEEGSEGEGGEHAVNDAVEKDSNEEFWDEFFDSLIITVPFTFSYLLLDILVHLQYQHRPTLAELASHLVRAVPTLGVLVFFTNRHANHPATIWFLTSASILSGSRLIWLVNKAGWSLTTNQAPPMGTSWILTIVQLPLSRAVLALAGVAAYTYHSGLKIMP